MIKLACQFSPGEAVVVNQETDGVINGIWCAHPGRIEYSVKYLNSLGEYKTEYFKETELRSNKDGEGWENVVPAGPFIASQTVDDYSTGIQGAD